MNISISAQRITMCPHGYHHNGFMETPAYLLVLHFQQSTIERSVFGDSIRTLYNIHFMRW